MVSLPPLPATHSHVVTACVFGRRFEIRAGVDLFARWMQNTVFVGPPSHRSQRIQKSFYVLEVGVAVAAFK